VTAHGSSGELHSEAFVAKSAARRGDGTATQGTSQRTQWLGTMVVVSLCALALIGWFPLKAMESQSHALSEASSQLQTLNQENAVLATQNASLQSSAVIAQVARKAYGLVQPGQSLTMILPPAATIAPNGGSAPFAGDPGLQPLVPPNKAGLVEGGAPSIPSSATSHQTAGGPGLLSRVLHSLQFWK
jgi:cell division protein FtsB